MKKDFDHMIDAARYTPTIENKPSKYGWLWIFLFYIVGMINRAFLVPFPTLDSLSIQNIMQLIATDPERYHREVKIAIYRMVFIALIVGIWVIFKII